MVVPCIRIIMVLTVHGTLCGFEPGDTLGDTWDASGKHLGG